MPNKQTEREIKWVVLWLLMSAGFVTFFILIDWNYYSLYKSGVRTSGRLTKMEPNNHQDVYYTYMVGNSKYEGSGVSGFGNPGFDSLHVGDPVIVYYLPAQPQVSCVGIPSLILLNETVPWLLVAVIFPTFIVFVIRMRNRAHN